jgi:hypothetical protein
MNPKELQSQFCKLICIGFIKFCKEHKINITDSLNKPDKLSKQAVYQCINGKRPYIPLIGIAYLASITSLSIEQLALYGKS